MTQVVRKSEPDDHPPIWGLLSYSYGIPQTSQESFMNRLDLIGEEFYLHEIDGEATATARAIRFSQNIRGVIKPMIGIAMVASAPEHRTKGHVLKLVNEILAKEQEEGYVVSTLYPFKDAFYMKLSYAKMHPAYTLEIDPRNLSSRQVPEGYTVRRERGEDAQQIWRAVYENAASRIHGAAYRSELRWKEIAGEYEGHIVIARNQANEPEGVLAYGIKGYGEGHSWAPTGEIGARDFYWTSLNGRDAILSFIYRHQDQIAKVRVPVTGYSDDYYHWLTDIHTPNVTSHIMSMARVIDVEEALRGLPAPADGSVTLKVIDDHLLENSGTYLVSAEDGSITCSKSKDSPEIILTIEGLTSLVYGMLDYSQLKSLGWIKGPSDSLLFRWFHKIPYWLTEEF